MNNYDLLSKFLKACKENGLCTDRYQFSRTANERIAWNAGYPGGFCWLYSDDTIRCPLLDNTSWSYCTPTGTELEPRLKKLAKILELDWNDVIYGPDTDYVELDDIIV